MATSTSPFWRSLAYSNYCIDQAYTHQAHDYCFMIRTLQLSRDRLASLHAADTLLFPGSLISARLLSWYDHRSDLFLSLFPGDCALPDAKSWGLLCLLALRRPCFERLVSGELEEHEIDAATMLAGPQDTDICYHVWHVERTEYWDKQTHGSLGSWLAAFLPMYVHSLSLSNSAAISISALTATRGGIHLFTSLGFQERGVYDYVIQEASGKQIVRHCTPPQTLLLQENEQIIQPCPMMTRIYQADKQVIGRRMPTLRYTQPTFQRKR